MKKFFRKISGWFDGGLRRMCGAMSPGRRLATILVLCFIFAFLDIYMMVTAIYDAGRNDAIKAMQVIEQQKIVPVDLPDSSSKQLKEEKNESE